MSKTNNREFLGALGIYSAGGLFWAFLPFFVGLKMSMGGMSESEAGGLGSAYLGGFTLISLVAMWWAPRFDWRRFTLAAFAIVIASLWAMQVFENYIAQFIFASIIGASLGSFWVIAYRIFALTNNPDRSFAVGIVISYSALALLTYLLGTYVAPSGGLASVTSVLTAVLLALAATTFLLPANEAGGQTGDASASNGAEAVLAGEQKQTPIVLALAGLLITGLAFAAVWAFAERIGVMSGFERAQITPVISSNLLASAAGSVLAFLVGSRFGRRTPLLIGLVLFIGCIMLLFQADQYWSYATAIIGLGFFVGFVLPYQMGAIGEADKQGKFVLLIAAAQGAGSALGAFLGGLAFASGGAEQLAYLAAGCLALSIFLFIPILQKGGTR